MSHSKSRAEPPAKRHSERNRILALPLAFALAGGLAAHGRESKQAAREQSPLNSAATAPNSPIADTWKLKKLDGSVSLTINRDGSWIFSGGFKDHRKNQYFDVSLAIKSSTGAVYLFHYEGDAGNGVTFSRQGESLVLKDDFKTLNSHRWVGSYILQGNSAGRREHYESEQRKLEEMGKAEADARQRHQEQIVAEKKREERAEAGFEFKWQERWYCDHAEPQLQQEQSLSSTGGVVSTVGGVLKSLGTSASFFAFF